MSDSDCGCDSCGCTVDVTDGPFSDENSEKSKGEKALEENSTADEL